MKKKLLTSLALFFVIIAITGFAIHQTRATPNSGDKIQVYASFYPLYDFASRIGGDKVAVTNMTPTGAEPHDFDPPPRDLARAQKADVFVYNGGSFEPWTEDFLSGYKNHITVKASSNVPLMDSEASIKDPHFWLDPIYAQQIVRNITDGLKAADPANQEFYSRNGQAYIASLASLDQAYRSGLANCRQRSVVSSHDAFSYLGKRYNLDIISIAGVSTSEEPSSGKLAEISQLVEKKNISYIFFESLVSPRLADTIALETGAKTLVFDPIEGLTDEAQNQGKDYLTVQRDNLRNLRTALDCQ
jgi:zinc transport system substrate-binding protein